MYTPPSNKKPVHLVKHLYKIPEKKRKFPAIGDVKIDGVYAYGLCTENDNRIFSRTGMQYTSLRNLEYWLGQIWHLNKKDCVIIFEVYKDGVTVNDISGGCRRKSVQYVGAQGLCHDVIPYQDFVQGLCLIPYITRKGNLKDLFDMQYYPCFNISEGFYLSSEEEAYKEFDKYVDRGEEGIIGREPQGIWQAGKKNEFAWKIKEKISYDLIVIGLEEGKGKYEGTTGKIVCKFRKYGKVDGEYCEVKCSGMTDDQRHSWWVANDLIIGKIVKVDAMTFSKNGLLREPRFKEMRADKLEADFI